MSSADMIQHDQQFDSTSPFSPQDTDPEKLIVAFLVHRIANLSNEALEDLVALSPEVARCKSRAEFNEIADTLREIIFPDAMIGPLNQGLFGQVGSEHLTERKTWIGRQIKFFRGNEGWTQDELAKKSGLPQSHISRLENGEHSPSNKTLDRISKALGKEIRDFDPVEE